MKSFAYYIRVMRSKVSFGIAMVTESVEAGLSNGKILESGRIEFGCFAKEVYRAAYMTRPLILTRSECDIGGSGERTDDWLIVGVVDKIYNFQVALRVGTGFVSGNRS
jgi:hypothetical protein